MALPPDRTLQMIASSDIGAFGALAFAQPQAWLGRTAELAGDELTILQIADVLSRVTGQPIHFRAMSIEQVRAFDSNLALLSEWLNSEGFQTDIPALRTSYPSMIRLETWLRQTGWEQSGA